MVIPREQIYATLFALGQSIKWQWQGNSQTWATSGRKVQDWHSVPNQPAFFQRQITERPTQQRSQGGGFGTTKWPLYVQWWIYLQAANALDPNNWPSTYLNTVMDAIDLALQPPAPSAIQLARGLRGEGQTLAAYNNGVPLVENVWIEGEVIEKDPVDSDTQILLLVPIRISAAM